MKKGIYSLLDTKACVYSTPFFVPNVAVLVRDLTDELKRVGGERNLLASHPQDFELYELGSFDDEVGEFVVFTPRLVLELVSLVEAVPRLQSVTG